MSQFQGSGQNCAFLYAKGSIAGLKRPIWGNGRDSAMRYNEDRNLLKTQI